MTRAVYLWHELTEIFSISDLILDLEWISLIPVGQIFQDGRELLAHINTTPAFYQGYAVLVEQQKCNV